jgi:hypothetical protein
VEASFIAWQVSPEFGISRAVLASFATSKQALRAFSLVNRTWHGSCKVSDIAGRIDRPAQGDKKMTRFSSMFDTVASVVAAVAVGTMFVIAAIGPAVSPMIA